MIQEPLYSRTYDLTNYDDISQAYQLIHEVFMKYDFEL